MIAKRMSQCNSCKYLGHHGRCRLFVSSHTSGYYLADYALSTLCKGERYERIELIFCKDCRNLAAVAAHLVCKKFEKSVSIEVTYYDAYEARESEGMCGKSARYKVL